MKSTDTLRLGIQHDHKPGGPVYVGVTVAFLADPIALNTAIRHSIDNTSAVGRRKNDTTLTSGLLYRF